LPSSVRRLPRYPEAIQLPVSVQHGRGALDFPMRSAHRSAAERRGNSRFPCRVCRNVRGVSDCARFCCLSRWRGSGCGLPRPATTSAPRSVAISRLSTSPLLPLSTLHVRPHGQPTHDSRFRVARYTFSVWLLYPRHLADFHSAQQVAEKLAYPPGETRQKARLPSEIKCLSVGNLPVLVEVNAIFKQVRCHVRHRSCRFGREAPKIFFRSLLDL
jgi:hypothetical protein